MSLNKVALTLIVVILLITLGCSSAGSLDLTRCITPNPESVQAIANGLTVHGGGSLRAAQAVQATGVNVDGTSINMDVWFLAAEIQGSGMESTNEIAVWAVSGIDGVSIAPVMWVNVLAKEFSTWGTARQKPWFRPSTDGIDESKACVEHLLR